MQAVTTFPLRSLFILKDLLPLTNFQRKLMHSNNTARFPGARFRSITCVADHLYRLDGRCSGPTLGKAIPGPRTLLGNKGGR